MMQKLECDGGDVGPTCNACDPDGDVASNYFRSKLDRTEADIAA
jgi:hypothetical protein